MNKQLREDLKKIVFTEYETQGYEEMIDGYRINHTSLRDYINANYVSKETINKEYAHISKINWSKFPPELKDDVPTPESEKK